MVEQARLCHTLRLGLMADIRKLVDLLEKVTPAGEWPIATYKELLFDDMASCRPPPGPPTVSDLGRHQVL